MLLVVGNRRLLPLAQASDCHEADGRLRIVPPRVTQVVRHWNGGDVIAKPSTASTAGRREAGWDERVMRLHEFT